MFFDAVFLLYIGLNLFLGFRFGLFRRFVQFGAFMLGMLLAQALSPGFSQQFGYSGGPHPADAHFAVYLTLLLSLVVVGEILGFAYADALSFMNTMLADRFLGAVLGLVGSVLQASILLYLFAQLVNVNLPSGGSHAPVVSAAQEQLAQGLLAPQIRKAQGLAVVVFRPVLPPEPVSYFAKTYT